MAFDASGAVATAGRGGAALALSSVLASASASAMAVAAAAAGVVGDNSDDGREGDGNGSSGGGCVNSGDGSIVTCGSVDDDVSDDSSCGGGDGCGGGAETEMTAAATAGVKIQQSTCNRSVEGGRWTRAQQRVMTNNKIAWPMMRAETKRVARERATVTRVAGE